MVIEIDPKVDVVFHNLFDSPEHAGLTLSLVNSVLAAVGLPSAVELMSGFTKAERLRHLYDKREND